MGVVIRQSFKQSIVSYIGVLIGTISTLFIYPLEKEAYGLILFILGVSELIVPFASSGFVSIIVRFFPEFSKLNPNKNTLLPLTWLLAGTSTILVLLIVNLLKSILIIPVIKMDFNLVYLSHYQYHIWALVILLLYNYSLNSYITNYKRIVIPAILTNLIQKIALPSLVLLSVFNGYSDEFIVQGLLIYTLFSAIALTFYLKFLGGLNLKLDLSFLSKERFKKMYNYSLASGLTHIGGIMSFRIDHIMVTSLLSIEKTGAYGISQFIGNAIEIPAKSVIAISNPIISEFMEKGELSEVKKVYHKSSLNLLILGLLFACLIWFPLPELFSITKNLKELWPEAQYIVLFILTGKLINMMTSVNHLIIMHSKHYRFNLYSMLGLGILNIVLNLYLIPIYGIKGAALATGISMTLINFSKVIFIKMKFNMWPMKWTAIVLLLPILTIGIIIYFLPDFNPVIGILVKSLIVCVVYVPFTFLSKISPELNEKISDVIKNLRSK